MKNGRRIADKLEPMVYEMMLHCADPDTEWLYDPRDRRLDADWEPSPLDIYLDFDHPWFDHHEYSRTVHYTEIDPVRILMRGHMMAFPPLSRVYWMPIFLE